MFGALIYVEFWLKAPKAVESPENDIKLYKDLIEYRKHDSEVVAAALKSFNRHLWYLSEEMVPLSLFSNTVSDFEKGKIAATILSYKNQVSSHQKGPHIFPQLNNSTKLFHLVGPNSWLFLNLFKYFGNWLKNQQGIGKQTKTLINFHTTLII